MEKMKNILVDSANYDNSNIHFFRNFLFADNFPELWLLTSLESIAKEYTRNEYYDFYNENDITQK